MLAPSIVEPTLDRGVPPPPDYYRDNLLRVLDFVATEHGNLLDEGELRYASSIMAASVAGQRLYARLIGRKGPWIRRDKLAYAEVGDVAPVLAELAEAGLLSLCPPAPAERLLPLYLKSELAALFRVAAPRKDELITAILSRYPDRLICERLSSVSSWIRLSGQRTLKLLQLLFFGDARRDLSAFVLEDLGMVRFETYEVSRDHRLFRDRAALERYLSLRSLRDLAHRVGEHPGVAPELVERLIAVGEGPERLEQRLWRRTLNDLGRWFERWHAVEAALECYGWSRQPPARERSVRLLAKLGDSEGSGALLDAIRAAPETPEEQDFGERFGHRGGGVRPPTTRCSLEGTVVDDIERHAIDCLAESGGEGWHLENRLPLGLTALAFWEVIFAPVEGAFLNPYQAGPVDLFWPDFAHVRCRQIELQIERLADPATFANELESTWRAKFGIANQLMSWRHFDDYLLSRVLETVPHDLLYELVCHVIRNLSSRRTGFPDLLVLYGTSKFEFVEVKGPTDQLQPAQRMWFKFLLDNDYPARVLKFTA